MRFIESMHGDGAAGVLDAQSKLRENHTTLAGGGITHGATGEIGFHAEESPHHVTDFHATLMKIPGLDARRPEFPGHKRLEIEFDSPIDEMIA